MHTEFAQPADSAAVAAVAGVVKFQREDPTFWPEVEPGTAAFLHKLAVRRALAAQGVPTQGAMHAHGPHRHGGWRSIDIFLKKPNPPCCSAS